MIVTGSSLQLESSHSLQIHQETSESLRFWTGNRRPDFEGRGNAPEAPESATEKVMISDAARAAQVSESSCIEDSLDAAENDPGLNLIRLLLSKLTGREIRLFDAGDLHSNASPSTPNSRTSQTSQAARAPSSPAAERAGFGLEYDYHAAYSEIEKTSFAASGIVKTADGREISFNLSLQMARSYHTQTDVSLRIGDARQTRDPLVINFSGTAAQLGDRRFAFDLNADGNADEQINFVTGGSGFLAFDRNGDGVINDGAELFGAKTGDGFAELATLDTDGNGWIDENDAAYDDLSVWTRDSEGNDILRSLQQTDVGAISLARIATPFEIKDAGNTLLGQVQTTGIYLKESGGVGSVQQVDLTV